MSTGPDGVQTARRQLAGSTVTVSAGLAASGLGTVVMMAIAARALTADAYAGFAVWWTVATLATMVFGVFEVYLARLVVAARASGGDERVVIGLLDGRALTVAGAVGAGFLLAVPLGLPALFADDLGAALLLPVFTAAVATQALQRGTCTGRLNFAALAVQLSADGAFRVLLVLGAVAAGLDEVRWIALACCASALLSVLVCGLLNRRWWARPRLRGAEAAISPLLLLLLSSIGPVLVNNGSVPWLAATHSQDAYTLGAFAGALTLARIPTQFISAIFSPLMAQLSHSAEAGDRRTFFHLQRTGSATAVGIGAAYTLAFTLLGPLVLTVYLGPDYELDAAYLLLLAAASSVLFVAAVQQAQLTALDRWRRIAIAWLVGTAAFIATLAVPGDPLWRAAAAPLVAVVTAYAVLVLLSRDLWPAEPVSGA